MPEIARMCDLAAFLQNYKTSKGGAFTHTSISNPVGSFYIPPNATSKFTDLYVKAVAQGNPELHLTEKHCDLGPILIDLDFRFALPPDAPDGYEPPRAYTAETVTNVFRIYTDIIAGYVDEVDHFDVYVLEKPSPIASKGLIKDGLHIVIPDVVTTPLFQHMLREQALPSLKKELSSLNLTNKISDVVDEAVIEKNNWQMLGSRKPGCERYRVTKIFRYFTEDGQFDELPAEADDSIYVDHLSIRNKHKPTKLKDERMADIKKYEEKVHNARLRHHFKTTILSKTKNTRTNQQSEEDLRQAQALVRMLSKERAETYNDWIRVGWCLRNIDCQLLPDWIEFSKQSPKFREGDCEKYWDYMRQDGACLGMGTLHLWAKTDDPTEYAKIIMDELRTLIRESCNGAEYDVARVIQRKYNHMFAYDSANKMWYHFHEHRWHLSSGGLAIKSKLPTDIAAEYRKAASYYINAANQSEDAAQRNTLDELVSKLHAIVHRLKKAGFQNSVMTECEILFNIERFEEKLDSNINLIGFNNGVFDLDAMEFRDGRPEDFVSLSTRINFTPLCDQSQQMVDEIKQFLAQVIMNENVRDYVMRLLSSFMHGSIREERFHVWTGSGGNGKSRLLDLYQKAFGDYCCTLPIALLTQKRGTSNSASPELARARAKRFAVLQEPGENERLNIGLMKEMTGGDKLYARALYREGCEFKPQFKMILTCNHLPIVPSDDGGTWRRIRVVKFESRFCDNPDPNNPKEFAIDPSLASKFDDWAEVFMSMLIAYYPKIVTQKYKEPDEVLECTREYQRRNDIVADFMDSCVSKATDGTLLLDHAYGDFKSWLKDEGMGDRGMRKSDFQLLIERALGGKPVNINRAKGWRGYKLNSMINDADDLDT